jgi:hypothetical protein
MPSQKDQTFCQQCGALVVSDEMPAHVREHANHQRHLGGDVGGPPIELTSKPEEFFRVSEDDFNRGMRHGIAPVKHSIADYYLERGDAIAELLEAVTCGATLEIQGPSTDRPTVRAWIESATGARHASADGTAIGPVLVALARQWKHTSTLPAPPPNTMAVAGGPGALATILGNIKARHVVDTEPCCYGFLCRDGSPTMGGAPIGEYWRTNVQRPFRGCWLWLFGERDAVLTGLRIGGQEQIVVPLPFAGMQREITSERLRSLIDTHGTEQFFGARCHGALAFDHGQPSLTLPTANVGAQLEFRFTGSVQGIVLIGEQVR